MAKQLKKLYRYWKSEGRDSPAVIKSWKRVDSAVIELVPEEQQEQFNNLLVSHSCQMEIQGFITGFRFATAIWKETMNVTV